MKVVFVIVGCVLFVIGGIGTLIIVDVFQHPRVGAEGIVGPLLGTVVRLSSASASAASLGQNKRADKRRGSSSKDCVETFHYIRHIACSTLDEAVACCVFERAVKMLLKRRRRPADPREPSRKFLRSKGHESHNSMELWPSRSPTRIRELF